MKRKLKNISFILILTISSINGQVLLTTNSSLGVTPDPSAVLHISDNNKGLLLPRVALSNSTDQVTIPTPVNGLLAYNTTTNKFNFWEANKWNRTFEVDDAAGLILNTTNTTNYNTSSASSSSWSNTNFSLNSGTTGWTDLNVTMNLTSTKTTNSVLVNGEGMVQMGGTTSYTFAIGLFVDGQLKVVRKFNANDNANCLWKKFEITGVFYNLTPNVNHTVKLYGRNIKGPTSSSTLVYGTSASGCSNLDSNLGKIFLAAQLTE